MQLQTLTNPSGKIFYIDRFNDLVEMAVTMKGQVFIVDSATNTLYGFFTECYSIIESKIPFPVQNSFMFYAMNSEERKIAASNPSIFFTKENPEFLISMNRRGDFENQNIGYDHESGLFYDLMTGHQLDDCLAICRSSRVFINWMYYDALNKFRYRNQFLGEPIVFQNMQQDETIQSVLIDKVSAGTKKLILPVGNKNVCMFIFRNTFPQMNRTDRLDIIIRKDYLEPNTFVANFRVYKPFKKSKLTFADPDGIVYNNYMRFLDVI